MSERFNRPRTPPSPPPPHLSSRKGSGRVSTISSSKSLSSSKSYVDRDYEKYSSKSYKTSYETSKPYNFDKYKSNKSNEKDTSRSSKYPSKGIYVDDYKMGGSASHYSSEKYNNSDSHKESYSSSSKYSSDKYRDKYSSTNLPPPPALGNLYTSNSSNSNKKYNDYDSYSDKASRYPKQESGSSYYGRSYDSYNSYENYSSDKQRNSTYSSDRPSPVKSSNYNSDKYGSGRYIDKGGSGLSSYGTDKQGRGNSIQGRGRGSYGPDKQGRGGASYGGDKHSRGGGGAYASDKSVTSMNYVGDKSRPRAYSGGDDRRVYHNYSPTRTNSASNRSPVRGNYSSTSYEYGYTGNASSSRAPEKQYLDRYVIGDSVVYGPPGQYPRNLRHASSPSRRPPSPPSPPLMTSRNYNNNRYTGTSPRRYASGRNSLTPTPSNYRPLTPPSRKPPSPPAQRRVSNTRRPPSPDSTYTQDRAGNYDRSKERYKVRTSRSPLRDNKLVSDRKLGDRSRIMDRGDGRRDNERRLGNNRDKFGNMNSNKRGGRALQRNMNSRGATDSNRNWGKDGYSTGVQNYKDKRNLTGQNSSPGGNIRRDSSGSRDRGRRLEDRLSGVNPATNARRRSPLQRRRPAGNTTSPRDANKKPRRPDDLRLWIESRKNEGGKKGLSQNRGRTLGKGLSRGTGRGDRSKIVKRTRVGGGGIDAKRRLGVKGKRIGVGGAIRKNRIIKKYKRIATKRRVRNSGGGRTGTSGKSRGDDSGGEDNENAEPGSTASIRRVILKPKHVSHVNNLEIKPRVMGKPIKKLLKNPKDDDSTYSNNDKSPHDDQRFADYHDENPIEERRSIIKEERDFKQEDTGEEEGYENSSQ